MKVGFGVAESDKQPNLSPRGLINALSVEVVDASGNQVTLPGSPASSATVTSVNAGVFATTLLTANSSRKMVTFFNDSNATVYVKLGTDVTGALYSFRIFPLGYYELPSPIYQGAITGLWSAQNGSIKITEIT